VARARRSFLPWTADLRSGILVSGPSVLFWATFRLPRPSPLVVGGRTPFCLHRPASSRLPAALAMVALTVSTSPIFAMWVAAVMVSAVVLAQPSGLPDLAAVPSDPPPRLKARAGRGGILLEVAARGVEGDGVVLHLVVSRLLGLELVLGDEGGIACAHVRMLSCN